MLPAHAPFEHVVDPQLTADVAEALVHFLVLQGAGTGDDREAMDRRQAAGDLLGDAAREVGVLRGA